MTSKPFIIKSKIVEPMLPKDSDYYDESQETRIQILQAMNGYLTVPLLLSLISRSICFTKVSNYFGHSGTTNCNVQIMHICHWDLWASM